MSLGSGQPVDVSDDDLRNQEDACDFSEMDLLKLNPFTMPNFSKQRFRYMALFDMEKWVSKFGGSTFPIASGKVTEAEALALQLFYQEGCCGQHNKITAEDRKALDQLQMKIGALLEHLRACTGDWACAAPMQHLLASSRSQSTSKNEPGGFVKKGDWRRRCHWQGILFICERAPSRFVCHWASWPSCIWTCWNCMLAEAWHYSQ